jgi:hypothetical protein
MGSETRGQELIVGCLAASAAVAAGSSLATGHVPGLRLVVGLAFTGVGLATVSMLAPDLAGGFAVLILTTTIFVYGTPLMDAVTGLTGGLTAGRGATPTPTQEGSLSA